MSMISSRAGGLAAAVLFTLAASAAAQTVSTLSLSEAIQTDGAMVDGGTLFVTEGFSGTKVHAVDLNTGQVSVALSGLAGPIDVARDDQGLLYATNWNTNEIRRGSLGTTAAFWSTVGQQPDGLLFAADGTLWCTLGVRNRIKTVDSAGTATLLVGPGPTNYPLGIAQGADGEMYVGGLQNGVIWRVSSAGAVDTVATVPSAGQFKIGHLEAAQGVLFASALSEHAIYRITLDGTVTLFAGTPGVAGTTDGPAAQATFTSPIGLAASDDGTKLYVTSTFALRDEIRVIDFGGATGVADLEPAGAGTRLRSVAPNPGGGPSEVAFALGQAARVRIAVFDVAGREVKALADGPRAAGEHRVRWDGRAADGTPVAAGVYFVRLEAGETRDARRVVVQR